MEKNPFIDRFLLHYTSLNTFADQCVKVLLKCIHPSHKTNSFASAKK